MYKVRIGHKICKKNPKRHFEKKLGDFFKFLWLARNTRTLNEMPEFLEFQTVIILELYGAPFYDALADFYI